jgi:superfamily II DNA or RNA helicase
MSGTDQATLLGGVTFLPGDPPRRGHLVLYGAIDGYDAGLGNTTEVEVVLPTATGAGIRRRHMPARLVPIAEAILVMRELGDAAGGAAWNRVFQAGLGLVGRGRIYPAVTLSGWDTWRVGPLDPADRRLLAELAACFPPAAHALPLDRASPIRLRSPHALITSAWDALADTLVRTAAAELVGPSVFASAEPVPARHLADWLVEATGGLAGEDGIDVGLRVELLDGEEQALSNWLGGSHGDDAEPTATRAVLQIGSRVDPSLIVDATDLFSSPAAVLAMFGESAEEELLRALRRGARAWPPLEALLRERAPSALDLDDDLLAELLEDGTSRLAGAGIEVLWPSSFLRDGLQYRASLSRVGVVDEAGFSLSGLVEFRWQATLDGDLLSEEEIDQLAEAKRGLVRLRGRFVAVDPAAIDRFRALRHRRLTMAEALGALLGGSVDLDGEQVEVVADATLLSFAERLRCSFTASEASDLPSPPGLADWVELRPYQVRGISWLHAMTSAGLGGCLADDMGLGKTLQVIALHLHRRASPQRPTAPSRMLVICPTSLLVNWEREVRRFAPEIPVRRYHGTGRSLSDLAEDEIVVTSYGIARREAELLATTGFGLIVADEAQHVKNPETAAAKAIRTIGAGVIESGVFGAGTAVPPTRLALTGTPVENRLSELWSILDWTTPGLLGPLERFVRNVASPIERNHDPIATERLSKTIRPFVLRRRKTDPAVAPDLPPRVVTDIPVPLTKEQATLYEAEVREAMAAIEEKRPGIARQALVLKLLTALKQICNHPAQYLHQPGPLPGRSGKLAALEELLDVIVAERESALVFSQFVECLSLVETRLGQLGIPCLLLHGGVGAKRRMEMVDAFQAGKVPVMLLSLKAGGVGLNLTRATHVVHYDRWWNPAVEDQATDRAHRIGQDRCVQIHLLMAAGTLEDRIANVIERKRRLAETVVGSGEAWIGQLSNKELADLVRLGSG